MKTRSFQKLFPVLCVVIFYEKIFSWFFVWVNFGDSQTIFGTQAGRKPSVPVRYDLPVAIRWSLLRRKEEGKLKAFEKYLVDEKKNYFLDALWFGTLSLAFLGFILIVEEVLGAVFGIFWTSLGLAQSKFRSPPVGS